ncbi:uncharacterized protein IL334_004781 [Kwoniella shivajii]|uniref:FCP1 homology domain-containing protein n=1 Tax=Kwoniella shivajii TaxID=564305 RepID=A0ABZ1D1A7_9TREE|nr:hypothetical protein IL334_004781 [Kwoniella shivajii]
MNTLSRIDSYLSSLIASPPPHKRPPTIPSIRRSITPPSPLPRDPSSSISTGNPIPRLSNLPPTPRPKRRRPPTRRIPPTYSSIKVPPPTTPLIFRIALVLWSILLSFWRSLVGETRSGRSRSKTNKKLRNKRKGNDTATATLGEGVAVDLGTGIGIGVGDVLRELGESLMVHAGINTSQSQLLTGNGNENENDGSEVDQEKIDEEDEDDDEEEEGEDYLSPVTRAPENQDSLDIPPPTENDFAIAIKDDTSKNPANFTFRLKSALPTKKHDNINNIIRSGNTREQQEEEEEEQGLMMNKPPRLNQRKSITFTSFQKQPLPASILSNPTPKLISNNNINNNDPTKKKNNLTKVDIIDIVNKEESDRDRDSPTRRSGILANPISNSILDPSIPAPANKAASSLFRKPSPPLLKIPRPHQTPFHLQKTLILDLDETLIHSTSRLLNSSSSGGGGMLGLSLGGIVGRGKSRESHAVEVVIHGRSTMYHVYKRPYVDHFLKKVASWYTLVIFTASMPEYADPVIEWLDAGRNLFARKLYRDSCHLQPNGSYTKDLALVEQDLSRVCFMDNSPVSYNWNKANALPIEGWTSDPNDEALLQSIPVLDSLRFVNDVRRVLGIRGFT